MRRFVLSALLLAATAPCALAASTYPTMIGEMVDYRTKSEDDTLIEIAYREDIGYVELRAANPELDPWLPGNNKKVILPKQHIVPKGARTGVLINLGEMRLYHFKGNGKVESFPLGIGREGLLTPSGSTTVVRKASDPTWRPTPRMLREKPELKAVVPPGPDNPMGPRALYLGWPQYAIHGTNTPWGIGRRVSSGCLRMYNHDIKKLYDEVEVGSKVTVIDQPVKTAWVDDVFYIEAHPNAQQADSIVMNKTNIDYKVSQAELDAIMKEVGDKKDAIDWGQVRKALRYRPGYPMAVSKGSASGKVYEYERRSDVDTKSVEADDEGATPVTASKPKKTASADIKDAKDDTRKPTVAKPVAKKPVKEAAKPKPVKDEDADKPWSKKEGADKDNDAPIKDIEADLNA